MFKRALFSLTGLLQTYPCLFYNKKPGGFPANNHFFKFSLLSCDYGLKAHTIGIRDSYQVGWSGGHLPFADVDGLKSINDVLRASATLPLLLRPVPIGDDLYVDGGIRNNLPTTEARHSGAKVVISVEIDNDLKPVPAKKFTSFRNIFDRVMNATIEQLDEDKVNGADIVIRPELINIPILSKDKKFVDEATTAGEVAARKALPRILERLQQFGIATRSKNPQLDLATPKARSS